MLGPASHRTLITRNNLAVSYYRMDRHEDGIRMLQETIALGRQKYGDRHWPVGVFLSNLGDLFAKEERYEEARMALEEGLALLSSTRGEEYGGTKLARKRLARVQEHLKP